MATVQSSRGCTSSWPYIVVEVDLSTIDPAVDCVVDLHDTAPAGARIEDMTYSIISHPVSLDPINVARDPDDDDRTNDTATVNVYTVPGGDLTGAVVRLRFLFIEQASGGITAP